NMTTISDQSPLEHDGPLPDSADVVIVGGGIIGITTAWYLSRQGLRILVCEKGRVAAEQSSRNWGWIRQQGRDEAELPIIMESIQLWENLGRDIGVDIGFRREGSLYLCENEAELARHDEFLSLSKQYGLDTRQLNSSELYELIRETPQKWRSALYTPGDGRAEPTLAVPAIARACAREGVTILENCAVRKISTANNRVDGISTERGFVKCTSVVCCGGSWSASLLNQCGIYLPQLSVKASVASTAKAPLIFNGNAADNRLAFRRRQDGGYTIALTSYLEVFPSIQSLSQLKIFLPLLRISFKKLKLRIDKHWLEQFFPQSRWSEEDISPFEKYRVLNPVPTAKTQARLRKVLDDRLPVMREVGITESWSGMIDATPDAVPVMDRVDGFEGLFVATGFSGHGFGLGPAAGRIMADLVQNNRVEHDLSRFRFSRFSDGSRLKLGPSI
ncbi:MAG: NAD(P)/FAD-dependent oxidoreductase, partial [Gammaproteobacteria bacterium]